MGRKRSLGGRPFGEKLTVDNKMGLIWSEQVSNTCNGGSIPSRPAIDIEELRKMANGASPMAGVWVQGVRTNAPSSVRLAEPALLFQPYRIIGPLP